jgi:hypothetical protein
MPLGFEARNGARTLQVGQWNTEVSNTPLRKMTVAGNGPWFWAVRQKVNSGHAPTGGIAILKVWAAIRSGGRFAPVRRLRSVRPSP